MVKSAGVAQALPGSGHLVLGHGPGLGALVWLTLSGTRRSPRADEHACNHSCDGDCQSPSRQRSVVSMNERVASGCQHHLISGRTSLVQLTAVALKAELSTRCGPVLQGYSQLKQPYGSFHSPPLVTDLRRITPFQKDAPSFVRK